MLLESLLEIGEFFDFLWGGLNGTVYIATVTRDLNDWTQHFLDWPKQRDEAIRVTEQFKSSRHVFAAPAVFNSKSGKRDAFSSSQVEWADYDCELPKERTPDLVVRTSPGRFHAYWKHHPPITSPDHLETLNKSHKKADDCWYVNKLLRVPGTVNQKNGWLVDTFQEVPALFYTPTRIQEIANSTVSQGSRSEALYSIGASLVETGATTEEIVSTLEEIAARWGKFSGREDGQIPKLVEKIQNQKSNSTTADQPLFQIEGFGDLLNTSNPEIDWIVENFLYPGAVGIIAGPPAVGKTQVAIRLVAAILTGKKLFDHFDIHNTDQKILFISYEMNKFELQQIIRVMSDLSPNIELFQERFLWHAPGYGETWDHKDFKKSLLETIENNNITGIIVDSLGRTVMETLSQDREVRSVMNLVSKISADLNCWVLFIHHVRKMAPGQTKYSLEDLYGNPYIAAAIRTSMLLQPLEKYIRVTCPKTTVFAPFDPFKIERTSKLDFQLVEIEDDDEEDIEIEPVKKKKGKLGI